MANSSGNICVKFSEKTGRTRLDDVDFLSLVGTLKERVSQAIGLPSSEFCKIFYKLKFIFVFLFSSIWSAIRPATATGLFLLCCEIQSFITHVMMLM